MEIACRIWASDQRPPIGNYKWITDLTELKDAILRFEKFYSLFFIDLNVDVAPAAAKEFIDWLVETNRNTYNFYLNIISKDLETSQKFQRLIKENWK